MSKCTCTWKYFLFKCRDFVLCTIGSDAADSHSPLIVTLVITRYVVRYKQNVECWVQSLMPNRHVNMNYFPELITLHVKTHSRNTHPYSLYLKKISCGSVCTEKSCTVSAQLLMKCSLQNHVANKELFGHNSKSCGWHD